MLRKFHNLIKRLEANAPESKELQQAMEALQDAKKEALKQAQKSKTPGPPRESEQDMGGKAMRRVSKHMQGISQGLTDRLERMMKARQIKPDPSDKAPKEYRRLVDKYYRALSEDIEERD